MVGFSDLSNELVLLIWNLVEVEDVYSFSTVSKKVYLLTQELLREHCRLKHRLSSISSESGESGDFGLVLKEILLNPRAARYPSFLEVSGWAIEWDEEGEYSKNMVPESDLELFKQAARDSVHVSKKFLEEYWLAPIDRGDEGPLIALLLILLPNLREVQMRIDFGIRDFCITEVLDVIAYNNDSCSLSKLHSVGLEYVKNTETDDGFLDFEYVRTFAALPSVTSIHSYIVGSDADDLFDTLTASGLFTNITNLSFVKCSINPKIMSEFLSSTLDLQRFFYSPKYGNFLNFDPFWIRTALLANARETLKTLTILADGQPGHFMGSLEPFMSLQYVQTDLRLLIGNPPVRCHKLSDMLPSSIVKITLHINSSDDGELYGDSIQGLADNRKYFDRLENITVVGVADVRAAILSHKRLISALKEKSIGLSFVTDLESDDTEGAYGGESHASSMSRALLATR